MFVQPCSSLSKVKIVGIRQWTLDECIPLLEKFIALVKSCLQETLKSSGTINLSETATNKHWFKLKTLLARSMLQYCAVLSQIGEYL